MDRNEHDTSSLIWLLVLVVLIGAGAYWLYTTQADQTPIDNENGNGTTTPNGAVQSIDWDEESIEDQDGATIITADDFPESIQVSNDEDTEFGVAGPITGAMLSPDSEWVAVTMSGAAHGSGWLYEIDTEDPQAVDFQYGGGSAVEEWSPDNNYVAFRADTPAETSILKVVDRRDIADNPSDTGFTIEVAAQEDMDPPYSYEFTEWRAPHTLCFTFDDTAYCADAETEEIEEEEAA